METRSRKRAEVSSAAPSSNPSQPASNPAPAPPTRPSKRSRVASRTASIITTRSRQNTFGAARMDALPSDSSSSGRRGPGRSQADKDKGLEKGKEKEAETKDRSKDGDAGLDLDGDDSDSGGIGILQHNFSPASTALQGLLRKLGAGFDELLPSASAASPQNGRLKKILSGLRADGEEGRQVEALTQLCELLSIGTEDSLRTFSVDSFVPVLVGLLNHEKNADIMLLAARALTNLCDVLPSSCSAVVHYGAVPFFCARLLTIEYMDLAEQSLQALKKISKAHPTTCLRAGALMAVLSYLDFFSTGVQRVALSTAANICKRLPADAADFVMEAVPLLTNLLHYHDSKVLDHACICLTRIVEAFASTPHRLDELCNHGLVAQTAGLISVSNSRGGQVPLSTSAHTGLIRLLSTCARGSLLSAKTLFLLGISCILKDILSGSSMVASVSVPLALSRPSEQIFEIVNLADELLPSLPQGTISVSWSSYLGKDSVANKSCISGDEKQEETHEVVHEISAREKLLQDQPELLQQFGLDLLPVLIQIYGSSVNGPVRHKCLLVIGKLMYFSTTDMIQSLLSLSNISSFLAGILAWKDPQVLIPALQIAEILMEKLPETFSKIFVREGVVHAVDTIISSECSRFALAEAPCIEKENKSSLGAFSRSRCSRRHVGGLSTDANTLEESKSTPSGNSCLLPSSLEVPTINSSHRALVTSRARAFKDKYFPSDLEESEAFLSNGLLCLKNLCMRLSAEDSNIRTKGKSKALGLRLPAISESTEEHLVEVITEMLIELKKGDGVSTFEFTVSGIVAALLNYFSCGAFSKDRIADVDLPKLRQRALRRYESFVAIALPSGDAKRNEAPMNVLVQKLQNALSSLERFPVLLSYSSRSSSISSRLFSGISPLGRTIKLRLCKAQGDKSLRDYSSNIVIINPLVSLVEVEDFLWSRVQRGESTKRASAGSSELGTAFATVENPSASTSSIISSVHRRSTRSRSLVTVVSASRKDAREGQENSSIGKRKAVVKSSSEAAAPQTRSVANRRVASSKDAQMKSSHREYSTEDELEISPDETDDALVIEGGVSEDDDDHEEVPRQQFILPYGPEKVHDVIVGDSSDDNSTLASSQVATPGKSNRTASSPDSEVAEFTGGGSFSSNGAMPYAAAAMAGFSSRGSRGIRRGRDHHGLLIGSSNDSPKLIFSVGGKPLDRHFTIFQAIQRQLASDENDDENYTASDFISSDGTRLGGDIYTITYEKADNQVESASVGCSTSLPKSTTGSTASAMNSSSDQWKQISFLDSILQAELPCDLEKSNPTYNILALLRVLEGLNRMAPRLRFEASVDSFAEGKTSTLEEFGATGPQVLPDEFINSKLAPKLTRQMQDALVLCSGNLPSWCFHLTKSCPFLFPFETRRQYFYSTAFGLSRALHRLQQQRNVDSESSTNERFDRLHRHKVRVNRNQILESAAKVMELNSSRKGVLEVEYFGEVGTGLGPTLEFYTLLSHALQKFGLEMWRSNSLSDESAMEIDVFAEGDEASYKKIDKVSDDKNHNLDFSFARRDLIHAPLGLFPRPWHLDADASDGNQFTEVILYFRLLGQVMAKALQDGRLMDIPLSTAFYKLVLGQELDLHDILSFDLEFGKVLQEMQAIGRRRQYLELAAENIQISMHDLHFRGAPIKDLCLNFTLPGYPDYILKVGGENMLVDIDNLDEYVSLVVDATVKSGIMRQMQAFKEGFNEVFDITSLQIFSPDELDYLLCGRRELWETETLVQHIKFDHGYTAKSPPVIYLLEIMGEFGPEQQRAFCQFVTGAPRLPPGGLAVLNPKLTIVRKHPSSTMSTNNASGASESADCDLPSVMTCANYLKLPPYSTKEIMYKRLMYALSEGQGSFDLS